MQTQTTTAGILLQTGNVPLSLYVQNACITNWDRIAMKNKFNSFKNSLHLRLAWLSRIKTGISSIVMQDIFLHGNISPQRTDNPFFARSVNIFHQNSFAELNRENSKLRTYKLLKSEIGREPYLIKKHSR